MSDKDGGPAFPESYGDIRNQCNSGGVSGGMSLRDFFAAKAMAADIAGVGNDWMATISQAESTAKRAYAMADAMLAARKVSP